MNVSMRLLPGGTPLLSAVIDAAAGAESIAGALAWVTTGPQLDALLSSPAAATRRIRLLVGLSFGQTEPRALQRVMAAGEVRAYHPSAGVFHPKMLIFRGARTTLLIGSANLTRGAFESNVEACLVGTPDDVLLRDVERFFMSHWDAAYSLDAAAIARLIEMQPLAPKRRDEFDVSLGWLPRSRVPTTGRVGEPPGGDSDAGARPLDGGAGTGLSSPFRPLILELLAANGPLTVRELYSRIKVAVPHLCEDAVMRRPSSRGTVFNEPAWKWLVRVANNSLNHAGLVKAVGGRWHLTTTSAP